MLSTVWPGLNLWYCLAIISSFSWVFSILAMDFLKKTAHPVSTFLMSTLALSWLTSNLVLSKLYFSSLQQRNLETDHHRCLFRGYERAGKTTGFVLLFFGNVGLYYLSEKSIACMLTFLSLSFYCLCSLFCIQPCTDFGTLDFLLSATVNQTLTLFGLRSSRTWLVMLACLLIAGTRYCLEPVHYSAGEEATSDEQVRLESGRRLLPMNIITCEEEEDQQGEKLANKDPSVQIGCALQLALSGSKNPLLQGDFIGRLKIPPKRGPKKIPESFTSRLARLRSTN